METGAPVAVYFEQRISGALFDDLVVITETSARWLITCKSGDVVETNSLDSDLINRAWWMIEESESQITDSDVFVIAQPPPKSDEHDSLQKLITWSREQPFRQTSVRVRTANVVNQNDRDLWTKLKGGKQTREPQTLASKLRLLTLNLDPELGSDMGIVKRIAESTLENGDQWKDLWNALVVMSAEARSNGAELNSEKLISRLPAQILLKNHGDVADQWLKLRKWGKAYQPTVNTIGGRLKLDNQPYLEDLDRRFDCSHRYLLVTGDSGIGKSVILAEWCNKKDAIYLRADALREPSETLIAAGCRGSLERLLRLTIEREILIVIDQLDRVENDLDWAILRLWVADLVSDERVRLVFGCASNVAYRQSAQLPPSIGKGIKEVQICRDSNTLLKEVAHSFPEFAAILTSYAPSQLLLTPRALDQLVKMGEEQWPETFSGFLDIFWRNRVQPRTGCPLARSTARDLATKEAERGIGRLAEDADAAGIGVLRSQGIIEDSGQGLSWDHDTTGDNIRAKILAELYESDQLAERLSDCVFNSIWRRAFRLFCVTIVEDFGPEGFARLLSLTKADRLLEQSIFDAVILASPKLSLPIKIASELKTHHQLMHRFIARFLFTAAEPLAPYSEDSVGESINLRAHIRQPMWERWLPTTMMVISEYRWFVTHAFVEGLEVIVQYLEAIREEDFLQASRPALILARRALRVRSYGDDLEHAKTLAYRAAIATLRFERSSASKVLRRVSARQGPRTKPSVDRESISMFAGRPLDKVLIWPLGPWNKVDDKFQGLYLGSGWAYRVAAQDLSLAKELFYACLIEEPRDFDPYNPLEQDHVYGLTSSHQLPFFPATHLNPSIVSFFHHSFEAGLDVVVTMVEFCLERSMGADDMKGKSGITLDWYGEPRQFAGSGQVYQWLSGNSNAPYVIQSLLMTLESSLLSIENYDELKRQVEMTLARTNNLALLAVLISVAKSDPRLLIDTLAPVLFSKELDWLDIASSTSSSLGQIGGMSFRQEWWRDDKEAVRFSKLEHRKRKLRDYAIVYLIHGDPGPAERAREQWLREADALDPDSAQGLRVLAGFYDRSKLTTQTTPDGCQAIGVTLPDDVLQRGEELQRQMILDMRANPYHVLMEVDNANDLPDGAQAIVDQLCDDLERAVPKYGAVPMFFSATLAVMLLGLKAATVGLSTKVGDDVSVIRADLTEVLASKSGHFEDPLNWDDKWHWTRLVAMNSRLIFEESLDSVEKRKALVALIQSSGSQALHAVVIDTATTQQGRQFCRIVLEIARVWAVEHVRLREIERFSQFPRDQKPSSLDLDYSTRVVDFIENGLWISDDRKGLGTAHSEAKSPWGPSNYKIILPALFELLFKSPSTSDERSALQPILRDLLEGVTWHDRNNKGHHEYDQTSQESWRVIGKYLSDLDISERSTVLLEWSTCPGRGKNSLELIDGLLTSYSRGTSDLKSASRSLEALIAAYEARPSTDRWHGFDLYLFGLRGHGSIDWDETVGRDWLEANKHLLSPYVNSCLSAGYSRERFLTRVCRAEYSIFDQELFEAVSRKVGSPTDIDSAEASAVARLLIRWSALAKRSSENRNTWRRLLAILEQKGERLAWQVLSELADRV